jgi:alkylation response protein AidB-like acyl-CoA dehydrogenase
MDFSLSKEEVSVAGISSCFGDNYWLKRDRDVGFPQEFVTGLAQNGWLGICLPEEYGAGPRHLCAGLMCAPPPNLARGERRAVECAIPKNE